MLFGPGNFRLPFAPRPGHSGGMTFRALLEAKWVLAPILLLLAWALAARAFPAAGVVALLGVAVASFFRDPERVPPPDPGLIVAPADGRVDAVEEAVPIPAGGGAGPRISIFLSVFDVHINRAPCGGVITGSAHAAGAFLDARNPDSALRNENRLWLMESPGGPVRVRQIAGLIARRIVAWKREGETVARGERIGMIRFGSRTDLHLPEGTQILVKLGDRVRGGETPVGRWPAGAAAPASVQRP